MATTNNQEVVMSSTTGADIISIHVAAELKRIQLRFEGSVERTDRVKKPKREALLEVEDVERGLYSRDLLEREREKLGTTAGDWLRQYERVGSDYNPYEAITKAKAQYS